jgi:maltose alpha-D-glucosyltransferase / alpha-amylase
VTRARLHSRRSPAGGLAPDPQWYREAVIYEIPIRAFCDSSGDGIGDLPGLTSKLDYLTDLGVTAIWLLPFYPSPMRDGGYDIADYTSVDPVLGTVEDFRGLLAEAHARGIRVITELVINHTSRDHPWFQQARRSPPGGAARDFYVWSDQPTGYREARIIFNDFETSNWSWDPVARAYYWHRFYSHQPDLNFDNSAVHEAIFRVVDFWLGLGVDGMRLDAVPYLYEREGTNCENLPETHAFLRKLRDHVERNYRDRMLLAAANQWPVDAAAYFGDGDECHMNFHFPLMPRIFMALQAEDRFPIVDILRQTPAIPEQCQWATFLRNHDELTLEMVTDQDRDYLYRVYAEDPRARLNLGIRRRLAPLLRSRQKVELVHGLLLSLPGTPVLYYGDEIGMGDNVYLADRDGVRTPMQWSADRNAGFSLANPQRLCLPVITDPEYHYEAVNVEAQEASPNSLLWWTKHLIAVAKQNKVLGTGSIEFLHPENSKILAYLRCNDAKRVLVVANLSRYPQYVELDLATLEGLVPVEMFGNIRFPTISKAPYLLTLSRHSFLWFRLRPAELGGSTTRDAARLRVASAEELLSVGFEADLATAVAQYVSVRRWFRGKARTIKEVRIVDRLPLGKGERSLAVLLLEIDFLEGDPQVYAVPVVLARAEEAERREQRAPHALIARVTFTADPDAESTAGGLFDAFATGEATWPLLEAMRGQAALTGGEAGLRGHGEADLDEVLQLQPRPAVRAPELEQSNTVTFVGERVMVKVFRQVEEGINAELEVGLFLSRRETPIVPRILGAIQYQAPGHGPALLALAQQFVPNEGNAWRLTTDAIELFFDRVLSERPAAVPAAPVSLSQAAQASPPARLVELAGRYLGQARQLGTRTGEVHLALASAPMDSAFTPEPFTMHHQQSIYQWSHTQLARTFDTLRRLSAQLPEGARVLAADLLPRERAIDALLARIVTRPIAARRIRCHGDLHLGQVLFTGDDFVIIDFEGEPARPNSERRYKRCPLRDVMGLIRSFSYAVEAVLRGGRVRPEDSATLSPWAEAWIDWVTAAYLGAYLRQVSGRDLVPEQDGPVIDLLLEFYEIEKVIYEIGYELDNRPDWAAIPLAGLARILARRRPV